MLCLVCRDFFFICKRLAWSCTYIQSTWRQPSALDSTRGYGVGYLGFLTYPVLWKRDVRGLRVVGVGVQGFDPEGLLSGNEVFDFGCCMHGFGFGVVWRW